MGSFGLFVEWEAQQIWGLSYLYTKRQWQYYAYKAQFIWYILVFALIPGTGFFMTEIATQEAVSKKVEIIETNNQSRIEQLNALIKQKTDQLAIEGKSTARSHYYRIQDDIDRYEKELKQLMNRSGSEVKIKSKPPVKDMFANASKALWGIPKETLIFLMFATALSMVYTGLMRKPIQFETETNINQPKKLPNVPEVTPNLIQPKTEVREVQEEVKEVAGEVKRDIDSDWVKFIEALFGDNPKKLNGVETISKISGIPMWKCLNFRRQLNEMGAINTSQGINSARWSKEEILEHLRRVG
jgi:hypothetical protein